MVNLVQDEVDSDREVEEVDQLDETTEAMIERKWSSFELSDPKWLHNLPMVAKEWTNQLGIRYHDFPIYADLHYDTTRFDPQGQQDIKPTKPWFSACMKCLGIYKSYCRSSYDFIKNVNDWCDDCESHSFVALIRDDVQGAYYGSGPVYGFKCLWHYTPNSNRAIKNVVMHSN